jgi:cytochrome d ubiquinol oxidase subunit II
MVYATVFSGFYTPFMLLLVSLIFRAVAIEFRSKQPMRWWRRMWDVGFCVGSIFSSFIIGVTMGNIVWGVPLDAEHEMRGGFLQLLHPYSILLGITTVALFMMHGAMFAVMKTGGRLRRKLRGWVPNAMIFFIICFATATLATLIYIPRMADNLRAHPIFFSVGLFNMLAIANIPRELFHGREFRAFLSSCASMGALMGLFGIGMFPNLVFSSPVSENSLHIYNAASSQKTLGIMIVFALIGVPIVIAYTVSIYWIFRGKVKLDKLSY